MVRVREYVATRRLWRIAALTAAGAIGAASHAEAALYYWPDSDPGFSQPGPPVAQRRQQARRRQGKKVEAALKQAAKPQGPLIIAISIQKQRLKIYDAAGIFAESPISSGMPGHPTPMGVFSVIQKQKLHHSNIYSGAPMPYMQRITWSGIAIHAGVLPGYPASHGCIRMPMAFAVKMWNWTRMGARVVVTPGEMTPANFSHPLLVAQKIVPQPSVADEPQPNAPAATKADKASDANGAVKSTISEASLELRPTVGHDENVKPVIGESSASTPLHDRTRTADASNGLPAANAPVAMTDASSSASPRGEAAARTGNALPDTASVKADDAAEPSTAKRSDGASSDDKPVETKPPAAAAATEGAKAQGAKAQDGKAQDGKTQDGKAEAKAEPTRVEVKTDGARTEVSKAKETEVSKAKDQTRLDTPKPAPPMGAAQKRSGQISVFVSRKDSKLYVRQNFAPLFDVAVTIAPSDRPLGTHVFTAQIDKDDANVLHWSVVSLPVRARYAEQRDEDERGSRRRKVAGAAEIKPMPAADSPAEALDRLTIPAEAMARIAKALSTGGSIIVSDQGIAAGETGEGTDFVVSLR
jgi:lipoprotein-anchoring transpeptidase ErfK/SrfK